MTRDKEFDPNQVCPILHHRDLLRWAGKGHPFLSGVGDQILIEIQDDNQLNGRSSQPLSGVFVYLGELKGKRIADQMVAFMVRSMILDSRVQLRSDMDCLTWGRSW